jgi:flagellar assembly factor FliW
MQRRTTKNTMTLPALEHFTTPSPAATSIHLPNGLIGLPEVTNLEIAQRTESWPFVTLVSSDPDGMQFLAIEAHDIAADYVLELNDLDAESLGLNDPMDAQILNIVTIHSHDPYYVTANLVGPVVINRHTREARQVIVMNSDRYSTHHVLVDERA